jgi:hypothetical protein
VQRDAKEVMAEVINRKAINYTVYPPNFNSDRDACCDVRTVSKARLFAKRLGIGSRLRRNINFTNKHRLARTGGLRGFGNGTELISETSQTTARRAFRSLSHSQLVKYRHYTHYPLAALCSLALAPLVRGRSPLAHPARSQLAPTGYFSQAHVCPSDTE